MFPTYNLKVVDKPGPAFGSLEYVSTKPTPDKEFYDNLDYDEEVNRLLDEVEEEFLKDKPKNYIFPEDTHHVGSIPDWYRDMLKNKIKEAKSRLENLSNLVCATSPSTATHIKRIEEDHSTAFCKMDYPRHPPMHKSWRSTWEFCYEQKCKETDPNHIHSDDCKSPVVEDFETGVRVNSPNVSQNDYPPHVICVARLFQKFAINLNKKINKSKVKEKSESIDQSKSKGIQNVDTIEDDWWSTMTMVLISNHLNELMIVVRREILMSLMPDLKSYFKCVIENHPNIVSVLAYHAIKQHPGTKKPMRNTVRKNQDKGKLLIAGTPVLKDEIGPLSMQYDLDNHRLYFDSVETMQLGKVIQDYMCLTKETTLLDIGSNLGVLSLIMAHKCEKVIKLIAKPRAKWLVSESEKLKEANQIDNVLFTEFKTENMITICEPLIERCITVAIVKLKRMPYLGGPLKDLMKVLRNLRSIWRVILYGSFTDQFHESIAVLMSEDDSMGERYLPMQGCILDKSPTLINAFDLVILFERKSLIPPKVELFAPGPTVNVAVDSEMCVDDSMDVQEMEFELPSNTDQQLENPKRKCEERLPSLSAKDQLVPSLPEITEFRFDHPPPPLGTFPPFSHPTTSVNGEFQFNIPPSPLQRIPPIHLNSSDQAREDFQADYPLLNPRFPNPHFHPEPYPPVREDLQFDCPLPLLEGYPGGPIFQGPYAPARDNIQDHYYPPLPPENYYHLPHHPEPYPLVNNEFQNQYEPPAPPLPPHLPPGLPINEQPTQPNKKKPQFFYPPSPPTRFPSPPPPPPLPPPDETDSSKKESSASSASASVTVIDEPLRVCEEEKVSEVVNRAEDVISSVVIKSEPIDPSYSTILLEADSTLSKANCDSPMTTVKDQLGRMYEEKANEVVTPSYSGDLLEEKRCSQTITVKDELMQVYEGKATQTVNTTEDLITSVRIKSEPIDPSYSKDLLEANDTISDASCYSTTTTVKAESLQDEKKDSNVADSGTSFSVTIKSELINETSSVNFSDTNCQNIPLPVTVESKSTYFSPIRSPDCEPMDMQISPSPPDFHSMETPIHNPRAFSDITPLTVSKNVSVADSEFPVQTNKSFLVKVNPVDVDREPGEISDSDEENETIVEEKNNAPIISRKLNRPPRPFPGKYSESPYKRRNHGKSPSPKRMRRSPTPDKRRRRSPLKDRRRERISRRSPLSEVHGRVVRDRRSGSSRSRSPRRR